MQRDTEIKVGMGWWGVGVGEEWSGVGAVKEHLEYAKLIGYLYVFVL